MIAKEHNRYYKGIRTDQTDVKFTVQGVPLKNRTDLRNHSPAGFNWGYGGSGPAQLALSLLADALGDNWALILYQDFKREWLSTFTKDEVSFDRWGIVEWARAYAYKNGQEWASRYFDHLATQFEEEETSDDPVNV